MLNARHRTGTTSTGWSTLPRAPGHPAAEGAAPFLEGWRPASLHSSVRWVNRASLPLISGDLTTADQRHAVTTGAAVSRRVGAAVKFLVHARGMFAGTDSTRLQPGATTSVPKRALHMSARWFLNLTIRCPELPAALQRVSRIWDGRFYSCGALVSPGERYDLVAAKLPKIPPTRLCPLCSACTEAGHVEHFISWCCAPELRAAREKLDLLASARKLIFGHQKFAESTGNVCSPMGARLNYSDEDLFTQPLGGSVRGRLTSVLRGCDTASVPHEGLTTHHFSRATSGPSKEQLDEQPSAGSVP